MKLSNCKSWRSVAGRGLAAAILTSAILSNVGLTLRSAEPPKSFATPQEASSALVAAASSQDLSALRALFGAAWSDLENPDPIQGTNELSKFAAAFNQAHRLLKASETRYVLEVGLDGWPFPVPIEKQDGRWSFDADAGKDELVSRRIGKNELSALDVVRAYVDAQREYASRDRDSDEVLEFAQRFSSLPGRTDGLYWPPEAGGELSPLGPWVAAAQSEGYFGEADSNVDNPQPYHGYCFRILMRQGSHAPGGKYDYIINGNMIGGFALVAWPVVYGDSGVMSFIVNQQGRVYQRDLGANTARIAKKMTAYDPDPTWKPSPD